MGKVSLAIGCALFHSACVLGQLGSGTDTTGLGGMNVGTPGLGEVSKF